MAKKIKIWYDVEADYLEVIFEKKRGYYKETSNDAVMKKIDAAGNVIGFSILKVSALRGKTPLAMTLTGKAAYS